MTTTYKDFIIEIFNDDLYTPNSSDNLITYKHVYLNGNYDRFMNQHGVKVYLEDVLVSSAIICNYGGSTTIHEKSYLILNNSLFICCGPEVYSLNLPDLSLKWNKELDHATCFGIYEFEGDFIINGELEISRVTQDGLIKWKFSGRDCFVILNNRKNFEIDGDTIKVNDFQNYQYILGANGKEIL